MFVKNKVIIAALLLVSQSAVSTAAVAGEISIKSDGQRSHTVSVEDLNLFGSERMTPLKMDIDRNVNQSSMALVWLWPLCVSRFGRTNPLLGGCS